MDESVEENRRSGRYAVKIAILYALIWFIDLLDATILNIALPRIADLFLVDPRKAEWAILGFFFALTLAIPLSPWISGRFGSRGTFLYAQALYTLSSIGCGCSIHLKMLIACRILQGFAGGILIPLGASLLMKAAPQHLWSRFSSGVNRVSILAPGIGPLMGSHVTEYLGWRWLFFLKVPFSAIALILSILWVRHEREQQTSSFPWKGYSLVSLSLLFFLYGCSKVGLGRGVLISPSISFGLAVIFLLGFLIHEKKAKEMAVLKELVRCSQFSYGILIQCLTYLIFLGSPFLIALFLQKGLLFQLTTTGWTLSALTPGLVATLPIISRFYNRIGPLPFTLAGVLLLLISLFGLAQMTPADSPFKAALFIFLIGFGSSFIQTTNVMSIYCDIPDSLKGLASTTYSIGKQLSASFGVAFSLMMLSIALTLNGVSDLQENAHVPIESSFHGAFYTLMLFPLLSLVVSRRLDNKKALSYVQEHFTHPCP